MFLTNNLNVLHNYFDGSTKLFSDYLYLAKFFDILTNFFHARRATILLKNLKV